MVSRIFSLERLGSVIETGQLADPPVQIGEAHPERIDVRMLLDEEDRDVLDVGPLDRPRCIGHRGLLTSSEARALRLGLVPFLDARRTTSLRLLGDLVDDVLVRDLAWQPRRE